MTIKFEGELEIDQARGVIYFHATNTGDTKLRVCSLPTPIPDVSEYGQMLDITHMHGASWSGSEFYEIRSGDVGKRHIYAFGRQHSVMGIMGEILPRDTGKRVYLRDGVLQVENDEQYTARLSSPERIKPAVWPSDMIPEAARKLIDLRAGTEGRCQETTGIDPPGVEVQCEQLADHDGEHTALDVSWE